MSVIAQRVRLSFKDVSIEIETEREELSFAIAHIYHLFLETQSDCEAGFPSAPHIPACVAATADSDQVWRACVNGEKFEWAGFDVAVCYLEDIVADRLLQPFRSHLLVHSAAVTDQTKTIFLAGRSGSGKTTLALQLVKHGMTFLTDEFSIVHPTEREIQPFPRAATRKFESEIPEGSSFHSGMGDSFRSHFLPENNTGLDPIELNNVILVFPQFVRGHGFEINEINSGEACARLLPSIFDFENREKQQWPQAAELVTQSRSFDVKFGDAKLAAGSIFNLK